MRKREPGWINKALERLSRKATEYSGTSAAFGVAAGIILIWLLTGPIFGFSDTWQLIINTGTTIVTFLMVFLIQRAQNKDMQALHLKLNELVAALEGASNRLIDVEDLSEGELKILHTHYAHLVDLAKRDSNIGMSHSVDEAEQRHNEKFKESGN